jgi:hypothetical protein
MQYVEHGTPDFALPTITSSDPMGKRTARPNCEPGSFGLRGYTWLWVWTEYTQGHRPH